MQMFDIKINKIMINYIKFYPFHIKIKNGITGIIGPNGSGKTTILKTIAGILDYNGKILYKDKDIKNFKDKIEYIPPFIEPLFPITVMEFFKSSLDSIIIAPEKRAEIFEISKNIGITNLLNKEISKLSSGETAKILFAKALITKKNIILWDEPTSFVDLRYKIFLLKLIKNFSKKISFIIASHDFKWLNKIIKNFISIKDGKIEFHSRKIEKYDIKNLFNI